MGRRNIGGQRVRVGGQRTLCGTACCLVCDDCIGDVTGVRLTFAGYVDGGPFCSAGKSTYCTFSNLNGSYTLTPSGGSNYSITGLSLVTLTITKYVSSDCTGSTTCVGTVTINSFTVSVFCDGDELRISGISYGFTSTLAGDCASTTSGDDLTMPSVNNEYDGDAACRGEDLVFGPFNANDCAGSTSPVTATFELLF